MIKPIAASLYVLTLTSCATVHYSEPIEKDSIKMSCTDHPLDGVESFRSVLCSFENTSDQWIRVSVVDLSIKTNAKDLKVSTVQETLDFQEAWALQRAQDRWNSDLAITTLALGGSILAISSQNDGVAALGATTAAGAIAYGAGRDLSQAHEKAQYPTNHILNDLGFRIPPHMYVKKYAIVQQAADSQSVVKAFKICMKKEDPEARPQCSEIPNANFAPRRRG